MAACHGKFNTAHFCLLFESVIAGLPDEDRVAYDLLAKIVATVQPNCIIASELARC